MAKRMTTTEGFVPPEVGARYYLLDERRWTTYGELVDGVAEDLRPRDGEGLDLLLLAMGALSEAEMAAATAHGPLAWLGADTRRVG